MKPLAVAILLLSTQAANAATLCHDAPGREPGVHWSWREIDGRRCWFKGRGALPPKSELSWKKDAAGNDVAREEEAPPAVLQPGPGVRMLKTHSVREGFSEVEANWIDGDAPVDLMRGDDLSGPTGVGGSWVVPAYKVNAGDMASFAARFAPVNTGPN